MKSAIEAMRRRRLCLAFALLILSRGYVLGEEPSLPSAPGTEAVALEDEATVSAYISEGMPSPLVESPASTSLPQSSASYGDSNAKQAMPYSTTSEPDQGFSQRSSSEPDFETVAAELAEESTASASLTVDTAMPAEASVNAEPGSFVNSGIDSNISEILAEEAPYPDITEFPIPEAAIYAEPSAVRHADYSDPLAEGADALELDAVTPAEYAVECNWLLEKLDGYREVQTVTYHEPVEATTSLSEVVPDDASEQMPFEMELPRSVPTPISSYSEVTIVEPTLAEPTIQQSIAPSVHTIMPPAAPQQQAHTVQQASAISVRPQGEPQMLTPPAAVVPRSALNELLDSRSVAAIYGAFVGILATLFLLLIGLILRSLVNRIMPRPVTAAGSTHAPQMQAPAAQQQQPSAGNPSSMGLPPQAQYVAYPHQHAYMPPVMMHPSFVYADVDPRQEERPRRPKSKSRTEKKRRSASTRKRSNRETSKTRPPFEYRTSAATDASTGKKKPEPVTNEHGTTQQEGESQSALYTKILEKNLQIRQPDGS